MNDIKLTIHSFLEDQRLCVSETFNDEQTLEKIVTTLLGARDRGSRIFTMGNGGSGSTASHFTSDLLKTSITEGNKRFQAISLVDNTPVLLAWSNDQSYDDVFIEQLRNFLQKDDIVIGFSGSGKSKNVIKAFEFAKESQAISIGFTGMGGGEFPKINDICLVTPSDDMLLIEATHGILCHCIVTAIRKQGKPLFNYG